MVLACKMPSWHRLLKLAWPWTIWMRSRMKIWRSNGKELKTVGKVVLR